MLTPEQAILLVADTHADQWKGLIRQADAAVRIECVPTMRAVPDSAATVSISVLCLDGMLAAQNSLLFIEEMIAGAKLKSHTPVVLLTSDATIAARYKAHSSIGRVLLCRSSQDHDAFVAEFRSLLAQSRMQAQLQLFAAALEGTANGLIVVDAHSDEQPILYANAAFTQLTGYSNTEVVGRNCRFLQGADTDAAVVKEFRAALQAGREHTAELINYRKDGTPFWNRLSVRPLNGPDGAIQYFV